MVRSAIVMLEISNKRLISKKNKKVVFNFLKITLLSSTKYGVFGSLYLFIVSNLIGSFYTRLKKLKNYNVSWLKDLSPKKRTILRAESIGIIHPPEYKNHKKNDEEVVIPAVVLYEIENPIVHCHSSNILYKKTIYIENFNGIQSDIGNYSTGFVVNHNDQMAIVSQKNKVHLHLKQAIFLAGNGCMNYYHWMLEIVPKILFLSESGILDDESVLLVSEDVFKIKQFKDVLSCVLGGIKPTLYPMSADSMYEVDLLYHVSTPNNVLFNLRSANVDYLTSFCFFRRETILFLREKVLNNQLVNLNVVERREVIFLARKQYYARSYNQEEVICYLSEFIDLTVVYLEELSFTEQVSLFYNARVIIGPSGAAFSNLVFCQPNTKVFSWLNQAALNFSVYSTLAEVVGINMKFYKISHLSDNDDIHSSYCMELDVFDDVIDYFKSDYFDDEYSHNGC